MSKNYDNWERLVGAVLRRESDRRLALTHSRDSSFISVSTLDLSFNSTARFDEDDVETWISYNYNDISDKLARVVLHRGGERIQYSDLQNLDHGDWKKMLLHHQQQVVWRSASLIVSLDRTGKNCFLIGSKNFQDFSGDILHHQDFSGDILDNKHWEFKSITNYRFSEVLELYDSTDLDVRCSIRTRMLSPDTLYAAYLLVAFTGMDVVPFAALSALKIFPNESGYQERRVWFEPSKDRSDCWMEIELSKFLVYPDEDREVQVRLMCYDDAMFTIGPGGLVIEGIEFRPLEGKDNDNNRSSLVGQTSRLLPKEYCLMLGASTLQVGAGQLEIAQGGNSSWWKWTKLLLK